MESVRAWAGRVDEEGCLRRGQELGGLAGEELQASGIRGPGSIDGH